MFTVIGSVTVDLFVSGLPHFPSVDGDEFTNTSLVFTETPLTMTVGGNGANSAYVLAALGADVTLCGAVGQDDLGQTMMNWLQERGVNLSHLHQDLKAGTSTTTVLVDREFRRLSFHHAGPGPTYHAGLISNELIQATDYLLFTGHPLLNAFRNEGYIEVLRRAQVAGAVTAMDIGPALNIPTQISELKELGPNIDYLIANDFELSVTTGLSNTEAAIEKVMACGVQALIVKLGKAGSLVCSKAGVQKVDGFAIDTRVTVGAGDSFNSGFMYALNAGMSPHEAAYYGNATAAMVLASGRGVLGAPTSDEVNGFINNKAAQ